MTHEQIDDAYNHLMFSGAQTLEKHIRHAAEQIVQDVEGGFQWSHETVFDVPFHTRRGLVNVQVLVPPGMHGFALQMVVEMQLREAAES